jgi:dTDP-4-dehydrorhamnose 3,5-epimerase
MEVFYHQTFVDNRGSYTPISTNTQNIKWDQCAISVNDNIFTFRGMHYQTNPRQTKYVKVVKGSIIDIGLNLQTNKVKYRMVDQSNAVLLSSDYAHGFLTLEPDTIVVYLVSGEYNPESEHSIPYHTNESILKVIRRFCDPEEMTLSDKDRIGK